MLCACSGFRSIASLSLQSDVGRCLSQSRRFQSTAHSVRSLYDILGIPESGSSQDVKAAFIEKSKILHPDKNLADPEKASDEFRQLASAYEILSDADARDKYDAERRGYRHEKVRSAPDDGKWQHHQRIFRQPRGDPLRHEQIKVDLSEERMKVAWEAYKHRVDLEETSSRINEDDKQKFRQQLEKLRSQVHTLPEEMQKTFRADLRRMNVREDMDYKSNGQSSAAKAELHPVYAKIRYAIVYALEKIKENDVVKQSIEMHKQFATQIIDSLQAMRKQILSYDVWTKSSREEKFQPGLAFDRIPAAQYVDHWTTSDERWSGLATSVIVFVALFYAFAAYVYYFDVSGVSNVFKVDEDKSSSKA